MNFLANAISIYCLLRHIGPKLPTLPITPDSAHSWQLAQNASTKPACAPKKVRHPADLSLKKNVGSSLYLSVMCFDLEIAKFS